MSILIKGMEMPTKVLTVEIHPDGYVCLRNANKVREAVPVPEHGRLIDADALSEMLEKYKKEYALKAKEDIVHLHKAWGLYEAELMAESLPTIIPADPTEEGEG